MCRLVQEANNHTADIIPIIRFDTIKYEVVINSLFPLDFSTFQPFLQVRDVSCHAASGPTPSLS